VGNVDVKLAVLLENYQNIGYVVMHVFALVKLWLIPYHVCAASRLCFIIVEKIAILTSQLLKTPPMLSIDLVLAQESMLVQGGVLWVS
jgi:hypothetical protein